MARRAADAAQEAGVAYAFLGALSVNVWGVQRPTKDVDLALGLSRAELPPFISRLTAVGFTYAPETAHRTLGEFDMVTVAYPFSGREFPLDLFPAEHWFLKQALARRLHIPDIPGIGAVYTMSPEDVILLKLLSKGERALLDARTVVEAQPSLDRAYIQQNAAKLKVEARLARVLQRE